MRLSHLTGMVLSVIIGMVLLHCNADLFKPKQAPVIEQLRTLNDVYQYNPQDTVTIVVIANDPEGGVLRYEWSAGGGQLLLPINRDTVRWVAPVVGGTYSIEVKVTNQNDKSTTDEISIEVLSRANPTVKILSPTDGDFIVQFSDITISASAFHVNGLQSVTLFINDSLISTQPPHGGSNIYNFPYRVDLPAGSNGIRIEALSTVGSLGQDSVRINVEGILPKTRH